MTPAVVVLTGPIRSGKTTGLAAWVERTSARGAGVAGILAPTAHGERRLCSIATGECRVLTAGPDVAGDRLAALE